MVHAAITAFPGSPIEAVVGGMHFIALPPVNFISRSEEEVTNIGKRPIAFPINCGHGCPSADRQLHLKSM